jgi:mitochondrial fission protein ELM1
LSEAVTAQLADRLAALARDHGAGLMVTPSRRTGTANEAILRARLAGLPAVVWDGSGENPYLGYLGLADHIVVTCDSVSMVSEAASTGKPVHVVELEGGSPKFRSFHAALRAEGVVRPFTGDLPSWSYRPLDDTQLVADEIRRRLATKRPALAPAH